MVSPDQWLLNWQILQKRCAKAGITEAREAPIQFLEAVSVFVRFANLAATDQCLLFYLDLYLDSSMPREGLLCMMRESSVHTKRSFRVGS
jgi:hypothetical protein